MMQKCKEFQLFYANSTNSIQQLLNSIQLWQSIDRFSIFVFFFWKEKKSNRNRNCTKIQLILTKIYQWLNNFSFPENQIREILKKEWNKTIIEIGTVFLSAWELYNQFRWNMTSSARRSTYYLSLNYA